MVLTCSHGIIVFHGDTWTSLYERGSTKPLEVYKTWIPCPVDSILTFGTEKKLNDHKSSSLFYRLYKENVYSPLQN